MRLMYIFVTTCLNNASFTVYFFQNQFASYFTLDSVITADRRQFKAADFQCIYPMNPGALCKQTGPQI